MRWVALGVALITSCGGKSSSDPEKKPVTSDDTQGPDLIPGVELPEVDGLGYLPTSTKAPLVRVTPQQILVEGLEVVKLADGKVAPADREDGNAASVKIPKLTKMLGSLGGGGGKDAAMARPPLVLALDRTSTYATMIEVMFSAKQKDSGWKAFSFLATSGGKLVALPITLPDRVAPRADSPTAVPTGRISVAPPVDESSLKPDVVLAKINSAYLAGVKRCYKAALVKDPVARGKVTLTFTVTLSGRVVTPSARGFSPEMDRCITDLMPSWVFPRPTPDEASFSITLQFVPEDDTAAAPPPRRSPATALGDDDARRLADLLMEGERPGVPSMDLGKRPPTRPADEVPLLRMAVSIHGARIAVWSFSGIEGTLAKPRLELPRDHPDTIGRVRDTLLEIAKKHHAGKARAPETKSAVLLADPTTPIAIVAKVMGAMRGGTGDELSLAIAEPSVARGA